VTVTYTDDRIHWEIEPESPARIKIPDDGNFYLIGDVFVIDPAEQGTPACEIRRLSHKITSSLVIRGSVFTLMEDLLINNIRFLDETGEPIPWRQIQRERSGIRDMVAALPYSRAKERLVRQIIRKHLVSQGMSVEGARVEICSVYA